MNFSSSRRTLALGGAATLLLTFLFIQQKPADSRQHAQFTGDLLRLKQLDAEINYDLLSSRYELLTSYDPFVRKLNELSKILASLHRIPSSIGGAERKRIEEYLRRESLVLSTKSRSVERFKSESSVLKNSLRYFPVLVTQASLSAEMIGGSEVKDHLANLSREILLYALTPHRELTEPLKGRMDILAEDALRHPDLKAILGIVQAHSAIIVTMKPKVEENIDTLTRFPVARNVDVIYQAYTREYDRALGVNANYRFVLYLCSVILLGFGADRTISLVKSRVVLEKANDTLNRTNARLVQTETDLQSANGSLEFTVGQLRAAQERYELAVKGANDGLWDCNLITGQTYFSPRWKEMLGYGAEELKDGLETWLDRLHANDRERVRQEWNDHIANRSPVFESEHRMLHNDGTYHWMLSRGIAVRGADGCAERMAGSQSDITGNKCKDQLTGLANRLLFSDRLTQVMRERNDYAILFLDVDRFKIVNDSLGHLAGDSLLRQIAERLKGCLRWNDTVCRLFADSVVARLGGDEFAILIENCQGEGNATKIANRVLADFAQPFQVAGRELMSTFSVGVALGSPDYTSPEDILRDADIAMYEAKLAGKARAEIFDPGMRVRAVDRMEIEASIRVGIEQSQFTVFYQPKVRLDSGAIIGFEALARWQHPTRGLVSPAEFIPIAEETGLIVPLGYRILTEACSQLAKWQRGGCGSHFSVGVNISSRQFAEPDLVARIAAIVRESGIEKGSLTLELTESAVMQNPIAASQTLDRLKALGIGLDMDDFGTGYSSLSYLQRFPFDTIKIDRSFVAGLGQRPENRDLIRTIVDLAKNFKMRVVAEGVETVAELEQLKVLGCAYGQGYLFSKPVNATLAGGMITEEKQLRVSKGLDEHLCYANAPTAVPRFSLP